MTAEYTSRYPYFIYPAVMALRKGLDNPDESARLRRIIAANVGDIPSLRLMLGIDPEEFASFYPDLATPDLSTNDTISSFLSHFGRGEMPIPQAAAEIPEPAEPLSPISGISETEISGKSSVDVSGDTGKCDSPDERPKMATQLLPTEHNARLLIKNRDYQGALEIIQHLSLNIPEKSIYFADQIRFLKKLIFNEARKNMQKQ